MVLASPDDPDKVFAALSTQFHVRAEPPTRARWSYLDTADWRLHRAGMTLRDSRSGPHRELILSAPRAESIAAPARVQRWPKRLDELPPSAVRDRIAPAVGVRALLALADVDVLSIPVQLLDDAEKVRVRMRIDQQTLVAGERRPLPLRVLMSPLRGYERDAQRCVRLLTDALTPIDPVVAPATIAMTAAGHTPGEPGVTVPRLDPDRPALESLAVVLRGWVDVLDAVRAGVLDDVDTEYLHEFRTAVRATRSLLRMSGDRVAGSPAAGFDAEFAWLGRLTTPVRDLDVYLLELAGSGAVDVRGLDGLDALRDHLLARRRQGMRRVRAGLRSDRGERLGGDWRRALDGLTATEAGGPSTREEAGALALSAYRRIRKAAKGIGDDTPADHLHRLRKRCKRMRYVVQSYESVYLPAPYRGVLTRLKKLQDCLGDIQDSDVQRRDLAEIAATLTQRGTPVDTVLAMGALRDRNARRDAAARRDLAKQLGRFCAPATYAQVRALTPTAP